MRSTVGGMVDSQRVQHVMWFKSHRQRQKQQRQQHKHHERHQQRVNDKDIGASNRERRASTGTARTAQKLQEIPRIGPGIETKNCIKVVKDKDDAKPTAAAPAPGQSDSNLQVST